MKEFTENSEWGVERQFGSNYYFIISSNEAKKVVQRKTKNGIVQNGSKHLWGSEEFRYVYYNTIWIKFHSQLERKNMPNGIEIFPGNVPPLRFKGNNPLQDLDNQTDFSLYSIYFVIFNKFLLKGLFSSPAYMLTGFRHVNNRLALSTFVNVQ
ncbi:CLUMA_CG011842, isoform A [Clunio marinus]|uniref:CLUMA_CG011842, isoform A n=1 Tax=Clunio marinus TaxID=568069 RepID=A0A1J1IE03_9DIPT|nr:CLUMA_CG011842, isoform A [Clunio marinus]